MDSDNGVFILKTKTENSPELPWEYRVAYATDIGEIFKSDAKSDRLIPVWEKIHEKFDDSVVYYTYAEAFSDAVQLSREHDDLEHGIRLLVEFDDLVYN